ncbi:ankyrin repeat domain-containing protein [Stutzerimonas stutzeri]|uniref:ankyrin repeat domain-containing protein n=1 Tax=Stutzerimonas stutzeri TaxID=316 RepID=UPI003DA08C70
MNMGFSLHKAVVPAVVLALGGCGFIEDFGLAMDNPETIETGAFWEDITPGRLDRFLTRHPYSVHRFSGWEVAPIARAMDTDKPLVYFDVLLKHKIDLNRAVGNDGRTALHWAIAEGKPIEIIDWLLEHGANPSIMSGDYGALSQAAIHTPNLEVLDHLLDHADQGSVCCTQGTLFMRELLPEDQRLILAHVDPRRLTDGDLTEIGIKIFRYARHPETEQVAMDFMKLLLDNGMDIHQFISDPTYTGSLLAWETRSDAFLNFLLDQGVSFAADGDLLSLRLRPEDYRPETFERVCTMEREAGLFDPHRTSCPRGVERKRIYDGQGW